MNRIRSISAEIFEQHRNLFTHDFEKNKAILGQICLIRSKQLRNQLAGHITNLARQERGSSGKQADERE